MLAVQARGLQTHYCTVGLRAKWRGECRKETCSEEGGFRGVNVGKGLVVRGGVSHVGMGVSRSDCNQNTLHSHMKL